MNCEIDQFLLFWSKSNFRFSWFMPILSFSSKNHPIPINIEYRILILKLWFRINFLIDIPISKAIVRFRFILIFIAILNTVLILNTSTPITVTPISKHHCTLSHCSKTTTRRCSLLHRKLSYFEVSNKLRKLLFRTMKSITSSLHFISIMENLSTRCGV